MAEIHYRCSFSKYGRRYTTDAVAKKWAGIHYRCSGLRDGLGCSGLKARSGMQAVEYTHWNANSEIHAVECKQWNAGRECTQWNARSLSGAATALRKLRQLRKLQWGRQLNTQQRHLSIRSGSGTKDALAATAAKKAAVVTAVEYTVAATTTSEAATALRKLLQQRQLRKLQ